MSKQSRLRLRKETLALLSPDQAGQVHAAGTTKHTTVVDTSNACGTSETATSAITYHHTEVCTGLCSLYICPN